MTLLSARAVVVLGLLSSGFGMGQASAQPLGTYSWQFQPYCNVMTVSVTQIGDRYTIDGIDDQCGATERAAVSGIAFVNPSGTVGFGLTIVQAGPRPVHVSATINVSSLSGAWSDDLGHSGALQFSPGAPSGTPRPSTAPMRIAVGHSNWVPFNSGNDITFGYFSNRATVTKASIGTNYISVSPSLPVAMDGRRLNLLAVEFCYQANATAVLDRIEVVTNTHAMDVSDGTLRLVDDTNRTDEGCRRYQLSTPYTLRPEDAASLFVLINYATAGATFRVGRTTFVVEPTNAAAATVDLPLTTAESLTVIGAEPSRSAEPNPRKR